MADPNHQSPSSPKIVCVRQGKTIVMDASRIGKRPERRPIAANPRGIADREMSHLRTLDRVALRLIVDDLLTLLDGDKCEDA